MVGRAICANKIQLNFKIDSYVDSLKGTSWGNSTVKQLLTMSSGAFPTLKFLAGHKNRDMAIALTKALRSQESVPVADILIKFDGKKFIPGSRFIYSNADTAALGLALSKAMATPVYNLMKPLWDEVGANHNAFWLKNSHGEAHAYSGFAANPNDWLLLGHYVTNNLKKDGCFSDYLKQATKKQIDNPAFGDNREYGYQIWTGCGVGTNAFCFVGGFGQLLLIEPKTNLVLYVHRVASKWGGINHWGNFLFEAYKKYKN